MRSLRGCPMDRAIIYPAAIPLAEDLLTVQRSVMSAIGYLIQATLGTTTVADGLACGPVAPPSMTLEVGPGSLTAFGTVDATPFSTLAASANPLMKMGLASGYTSLNFVAPPGAGTSVDYLVQAMMEELTAPLSCCRITMPPTPASPGQARVAAAQHRSPCGRRRSRCKSRRAHPPFRAARLHRWLMRAGRRFTSSPFQRVRRS